MAGSEGSPFDGAAASELQTTHPTPQPQPGPGPLHGVRVVEIASSFTAFAGRLLADAGADVVLIEPPDGADQRYHGPFADDRPTIETGLSWWAENTSKRSAVADLETGPGRQFFRQLIETADVLLEAESPGRLQALGLDYQDLTGKPISTDRSGNGGTTPGPPPVNADLIHVSVTPYGRDRIGGGDDATDLTILARGGPLWSCGYDDHSLPPVRGRGNHGIRIAANFAVLATLTAMLARPRHGGQFIDVGMVAAANVTTEFASYSWLVSRQIVQRQTGRHAFPARTEAVQFLCADGRYLTSGLPPRTPGEFEALASWLEELGLADDFAMTPLLSMGAEYRLITLEMIQEDDLAGEVFQAGREAIAFIASRLPAHDAFVGFQQRGIAVGVVWSPDEVMTDPHFVERGFPTEVYHSQIDKTVLYPGPPIRFTGSPMAIRAPAPRLGEHTAEIQGELDSS